jgi:hypothetical protein
MRSPRVLEEDEKIRAEFLFQLAAGFENKV